MLSLQHRSTDLAILIISVALVYGQQFPRHITQYDSMGLSGSCVEVLNSTVQCSEALADYAPDLYELLCSQDPNLILTISQCSWDGGESDEPAVIRCRLCR